MKEEFSLVNLDGKDIKEINIALEKVKGATSIELDKENKKLIVESDVISGRLLDDIQLKLLARLDDLYIDYSGNPFFDREKQKAIDKGEDVKEFIDKRASRVAIIFGILFFIISILMDIILQQEINAFADFSYFLAYCCFIFLLVKDIKDMKKFEVFSLFVMISTLILFILRHHILSILIVILTYLFKKLVKK